MLMIVIGERKTNVTLKHNKTKVNNFTELIFLFKPKLNRENRKWDKMNRSYSIYFKMNVEGSNDENELRKLTRL